MQATTATQKLIEYLKANSDTTKGKESRSEDGTRYRYDRIALRQNAPNWLVSLFEKIAVENGFRRYCTQITIGNNSISYDRPKFKGEPNGKIIMAELIEL